MLQYFFGGTKHSLCLVPNSQPDRHPRSQPHHTCGVATPWRTSQLEADERSGRHARNATTSPSHKNLNSPWRTELKPWSHLISSHPTPERKYPPNFHWQQTRASLHGDRTIFPLFARSLSIPRAFLAFLAFSLQPPPEGGKNKTARQASQSRPGFLAPFARENGLLTAASWPGQPPSKAGKPKGRRCEEKNTVPTLQKGSEIKSLFLPSSLSHYAW